ncbi:MAG: hemerythrin-like domain-containing protein [Polyangiales bacterium]|jgi:hemerythrin-like domain-containing protein
MHDKTIDELIQSHDTQRTLMRRLLHAQSGSDGRESLFLRLKRAVEGHRAIEDEVLHPVLANLLGAKHPVDDEHQQLGDMLEELAEMPLYSPEWMTKAEKFVERNRVHLNEEEKVLFPAIRAMRERKALAEARAASEGMLPNVPTAESEG